MYTQRAVIYDASVIHKSGTTSDEAKIVRLGTTLKLRTARPVPELSTLLGWQYMYGTVNLTDQLLVF